MEKAEIGVGYLGNTGWIEEPIHTLLDFVNADKIAIREEKNKTGYYKITLNIGFQTIVTYSALSDIEKDLSIMLAQKYLYLGDPAKITTRFCTKIF